MTEETLMQDEGGLSPDAPSEGAVETPKVVRIQVAATGKLNLADFQNAVPAVRELAIVNDTDSGLTELSLAVSSEPSFIKPRTWMLDAVGPGATYHVKDVDVRINGALLSRLTEAERATLKFELSRRGSSEVIASTDLEVELLPRNQWGGIGQLPEMVAAFVQPNDPAIDHLLRSASQALQNAGLEGSITGYDAGAKRAWELGSGIWTAFQRRRLIYSLPPASFEETGQKVRSASQVLEGGVATCLDLALMFAASLEQAHLNPLLVITRGHAFVGYWLKDEQFSTPVVDDITALRKRVQLKELLVFETTLVTQERPVPFSHAIEHAVRQLSEEEQDKFELAVDIKRARMSRIRPLAQAEAPPTPAAVTDESEIRSPESPEEAPDLPDELTGSFPAARDVKDRLTEWQRKLLDLSLRNALLNFKASRRSLMLEVYGPAFEDVLASDQAIKLLPSPVLMDGSDPRSRTLHESRNLEDLRRGHSADALARREVFVRLDKDEMESRLVELYRGAKTSLQEGGANTLFVALGFLVWIRPDRPEMRVKAPLLLLPVTLERKSARSGFTIRAHEDEVRFNPTLVEMLKQDFELDLGVPSGDLPRDESGLDVPGIWNRVRLAIRDISGWEINEDVVLSMFSFAKYLMWKDLVDRTEDLRRSPVVRHLIDTPREPYRSNVAFPDARALDQDYLPQQVFSPLPADSSQLSAVLAASRGKDFVLIGPPGTGKSQTIANLIAQCLAEGKRVLFVAEKIAALDVVHRRLREVGLSEFCLELHSSKTRKLDVLAQLHKAWESTGDVDQAGWADKADQLRRVRDQLSGYVARLHTRHGNGLTIFQAIGTVVSGQSLPDMGFDWGSSTAHDAATFSAMRDIAERLGVNASAVGVSLLAGGPLAPVHAREWSAGWQQELVRSTLSLRDASQALSSAAKALGDQLRMPWPALTKASRTSLGILARTLPLAAHRDWRFCAMPNGVELSARLKAAAELLVEHRRLSAQMSAPWSPEVQERLRKGRALLANRQRVLASLGAPLTAMQREDLARGIQALEQRNALLETLSVKYGAGLAGINVSQLQREWAKAEKAVWPISWNSKRKIRSELEAVIEGTGDPRIAEDLAALVAIRSIETELSEIDLGPSESGYWKGARTNVENARCALNASAALHAARSGSRFALDGVTAAASGHCGDRWSAEMERLEELLQLDRRIASQLELSAESDGLWRGGETDVEALDSAVALEHERLGLLSRGATKDQYPLVADGRCGERLKQELSLINARAAIEQRLRAMPDLDAYCSDVWAGLDTDLELVSQARRFHSLLQSALSGLPATIAGEVCKALEAALGSRSRELGGGGVIGQLCSDVMSRLSELNSAIDAFCTLARQPEAVRRDTAELSTTELVTLAEQVHAHYPDLRGWCGWRNAETDASTVGLDRLGKALSTGDVTPRDCLKAFDVGYARWWLAHAIDEDDILKKFVSAEHERRIENFRALDEEFTKITRQWIRAKLCADLPGFDSPLRSAEWGALRREITKKRMHKPLRQLLQEIPSVVMRLTPCLLMSPLSIAQYLSPDASNFDIVIFDEASQIPVWDAIGAMARGKQVVMVGDPKQLPPTNFFDRADSSEGDSADVEGDLESILDECIGASLPMRNLSWHYRSRHESLIAFSNHRYYGGGLVTFPSPVTDDRAVSFHFINGQYEKGGARINKPEAKALVRDLVARLKTPGFRESRLTIGVVTFNAEQQRLIEDLLDAERRQDPGLEPYFDEDELEPVFVKNLESVQGDERDIMYFSVTYAPDLTGALAMNFGPLNRDGGERRLNVAITRARCELRVFSGIRGDQIDLSRTKATGVLDLKHFLEFAERGPRALAEANLGSRGDIESPFEGAVAAALATKGWRVETQIGASSFRVDLGVVHPDFPGRYLAGIECDGATYHRSATARDRDKLREEVLRGLGWKIVRIWSTDWWVNPGGTLERVHSQLTALLAQARAEAQARATADAQAEEAAQAPVTGETKARAPAEYARQHRPVSDVSQMRPVLKASSPAAAVSADAISSDAFHESAYDPILLAMIDHVVSAEGPILDMALARRIARAHGFQRTGGRIQDRVDQLAKRSFKVTRESAGLFYWPKEREPGTPVEFRWPANEESIRGVEEICEQELVALARSIVSSGQSGDSAVVAMAREIGLSRLRAVSRPPLEAALRIATGESGERNL